MPANCRWDLTLILLTWRIWWAPNNASRWQMEFNSPFQVLKANDALTQGVLTTSKCKSFILGTKPQSNVPICLLLVQNTFLAEKMQLPWMMCNKYQHLCVATFAVVLWKGKKWLTLHSVRQPIQWSHQGGQKQYRTKYWVVSTPRIRYTHLRCRTSPTTRNEKNNAQRTKYVTTSKTAESFTRQYRATIQRAIPVEKHNHP